VKTSLSDRIHPYRIPGLYIDCIAIVFVNEVKMKPRRRPQGQISGSVPELIKDLRVLSADMQRDPALSGPAKHILRAVEELEDACQQAWEVYEECEAANNPCRGVTRTPKSVGKTDDAAEWFRNLPAASQLKQ
jgi:hypothetical protein